MPPNTGATRADVPPRASITATEAASFTAVTRAIATRSAVAPRAAVTATEAASFTAVTQATATRAAVAATTMATMANGGCKHGRQAEWGGFP